MGQYVFIANSTATPGIKLLVVNGTQCLTILLSAVVISSKTFHVAG